MICVKVMLSITLLLSNPNPSDPINMEAARVLRNDPEQYNRMVRTMTRRQNILRNGRGRQARSIGGNEEGVAEPDIVEQGAGGQAMVQEEEEGVVRREADAEANNEEEAAAAVDGGGPDDVQGDVDAETNNEEETAVAEGVDPAQNEPEDEENA